MPFGNVLGEWGEMMIIVREMKPKEDRELEELFSQHPYAPGWEEDEDLDELFEDPEDMAAEGWVRQVRRDETGDYPSDVYETDKGFMNEECALLWLQDYVRPFIEARGVGKKEENLR